MCAKETYTCKNCGDTFKEYPSGGTTFCTPECYNQYRSGPYTDREWLSEKYTDEGLTIEKIAELAGCAENTIHQWLNKHDIERRGVGYRPVEEEPYRDKEWLETQYIEKEKSTRQIAGELNCSYETIRRWVNRHGIEFTHSQKVKESWEGADKRKEKVGERFAEIHKTIHPFFFTHKSGYERVGSSDGDGGTDFVTVHRLVAVAKYGIEEVKDMVVHHRNGVKWDNRPENLEIMTAENHSRHHAIKNNRELPRWWED